MISALKLALSWKILRFLSFQILHIIALEISGQKMPAIPLKGWSTSIVCSQSLIWAGGAMLHPKDAKMSAHIFHTKGQWMKMWSVKPHTFLPWIFYTTCFLFFGKHISPLQWILTITLCHNSFVSLRNLHNHLVIWASFLFLK